MRFLTAKLEKKSYICDMMNKYILNCLTLICLAILPSACNNKSDMEKQIDALYDKMPMQCGPGYGAAD